MITSAKSVFSLQLKFIHSPFQANFIAAPDLRWKHQNATVRAIGEGAGNMTFILMERAGHMVRKSVDNRHQSAR